MKNRHTVISVIAFCMVLSLCGKLCARDIPRLPDDPNITHGVLPNGISYYMAKNGSEKGLVEFALVQKIPYGEDSLAAVLKEKARKTLDSVARIGGDARSFMARNGMSASKNAPVTRSGMVNFRDGAIIYRFGTGHSSRGETVTDSTLLMIFGIIEEKIVPLEDNAIIVSGDIDRNQFQKKIGMLSLIIPKESSGGQSVKSPQEKVSQPADSARCTVVVDPLARYSSVRVVYSTPRPPVEVMGTVLPLVSDRLGDIMGRILKKRLSDEMRRNGVPAGRIDYKYYRSTEQGGDERYEISIYTDSLHTSQATGILASVLAGMSGGVPVEEFVDARGEYLMDLYGKSLESITANGKYVDMCISSFLYGSDLSTKQEKFRFFVRGKMDDSTESGMFNRFVTRLIDSIENARIAVRTGSRAFDSEGLWQVFSHNWTENILICKDYSAGRSDTLLLKMSPGKMKVKSTKTDPVSGGTLWTFENGVNVVYKKMSTGGLFYYRLAIRGGYSAMKDIKHGEGAFLSDMLHTYNIADMSARRFNNMLLANGIAMDGDVNLSEMNIFGVAPRKSLGLMMKSVAAIANGRSIDQETFDYYRDCEKIRLEARRGLLFDRLASIDSVMCSTYNYSSFKTLEAVYPDLQDRAKEFFDEQFSRVNDGVFVMVGDMDEASMKKFLQENIALFRTMPGHSARVSLPYQPVSGGTTRMIRGRLDCVDVVMSAPMQFGAENYMAAKIAERAVADALNAAFCKMGVSISVSSSLGMYPQERLGMMISVEDVPVDRFPAGNIDADAISMLYRIRETLNSLSREPLSAFSLNVCKKMVIDDLASSQSDPEYWMSAVVTRYLHGKDLNTKYADKVNAVTAEKVQEIIGALNGGSKVEYVVRK